MDNPIVRLLLGIGSALGIVADIYGLIWAFSHLIASDTAGAVIGYGLLIIILLLLALPIIFFGIFGIIVAAIWDD